MKTSETCRIVHVEKAWDGVAVTFEDGRTAFFSPALLHSVYSQALDLSCPDPDED